MAPMWAAAQRELAGTVVGYAALWLVGLGGLLFARRRLRAALVASHEYAQRLRELSRVFETAVDPIIIADLDGVIVEANEEAARTYGWSRAELVGRRILELVPESHRAAVVALSHRCRQGENVRDVESARLTQVGRRGCRC
jgi:PAS domain S-box-containing protein